MTVTATATGTGTGTGVTPTHTAGAHEKHWCCVACLRTHAAEVVTSGSGALRCPIDTCSDGEHGHVLPETVIRHLLNPAQQQQLVRNSVRGIIPMIRCPACGAENDRGAAVDNVRALVHCPERTCRAQFCAGCGLRPGDCTCGGRQPTARPVASAPPPDGECAPAAGPARPPTPTTIGGRIWGWFQARFTATPARSATTTAANSSTPKPSAPPAASESSSEQALRDLMARQGWRACPCGQAIERTAGCNHMKHPSCQYAIRNGRTESTTHFCYCCGTELDRGGRHEYTGTVGSGRLHFPSGLFQACHLQPGTTATTT